MENAASALLLSGFMDVLCIFVIGANIDASTTIDHLTHVLLICPRVGNVEANWKGLITMLNKKEQQGSRQAC